MARKYDLISELYDRTCKTVSANPQNWQAFLQSACRNYKLRFDEQILVFAQKPNAKAVLEIQRWNSSFGRWVNRGAKGIAVFEDADRSRQRLIYYFDISDTHAGPHSRPVPVWEMKPEYEDAVIETLESNFGETENKRDLANVVLCAAANAVDDNITDYTSDLLISRMGSLLGMLDNNTVVSNFHKTVTNSVAFMIMSRLGIDTSRYFSYEDFKDIVNFNTTDTLNALGFATGDIAEMGLSEISKTVMSFERQNRTFAEYKNSDYNIDGNKNTEGSPNYDRENNLYNAGRLQPSELGNAQPTSGGNGQIRSNEESIFEGTPQSSILQSPDELQTERTLSGGSADGNRDGGTLNQRNGGERGRDRTDEGDGYDEVGSPNEQSEELGAGDRESGSNLRLDWYDREHEDKSLPFFGGDDTIREILDTTPHLKASKDEIRAFFETVADDDKRTEYIKSIFNNDYTEVILSDGRRVGYKTFQNVLHLWEGSYLSRTAQSYYDWGVMADHFEAMRLLGELYDTAKPLPSIDGQMSLILDYEAEVTKPSAFSFSQEIIDLILCKGGQVSEGKFRIYEQFQKSLSKKENVDFLKHEYGWGGSYPIIVGTGIDEMHDAKGIKLTKQVNGEKVKILLNWNQVENRISELIKMDRYLNPKEKELYPAWLEQHEIRRAEVAEKRRKREILSTAPTDKNEPETTTERYEYHLGNKVYIGASEYEILSFDDDRVMLYDTQFPLFNKEMSRAEFDQKVQENPMNDHLKVKDFPAEETPDNTKVRISLDSGNDLVHWIYYNPDANAGGQYVSGDLSFSVFEGLIEQYDIANHPENTDRFVADLEEMSDQFLADINTPFFMEAENDYEMDCDYIQFTPENILKIHKDIQQFETEHQAELNRMAGQNEPNALPVYDREAEILYDVLSALKIDNVELTFDGDKLVATDSMDNEWHGKEFYEFLVKETFVFDDNGKVVGIDDDLLKDFTDLSEHNGIPVKDNRVKQLYRGYLEVKTENPDNLVLYQVGDFFESYNDDAQKVADALDLIMTSRLITDNDRVSMVGLPKHRLETSLNMLTDRGYDVALSILEGGERKVYNFVSQNKENPVESRPIGRIEYLRADGTVQESIEYTRPSHFERDIKEEKRCGDSMQIVLYGDKDGKTISVDFLSSLNLSQSVKIIDSPYLETASDKAIDYKSVPTITCVWSESPVFEDGKTYSIAEFDRLMKTADDERVAGKKAAIEKYGSSEAWYNSDVVDEYTQYYGYDKVRFTLNMPDGTTFTERQDIGDGDGGVIEFLSQYPKYNDIVPILKKTVAYLSTEQQKPDSTHSKIEQAEKAHTPAVPAWEQPKKSKLKPFDLHPETPMADRHNFNLASHKIEEVGKKERFQRNMEAIKVLKACELENSFATPEEQITLSKYVGWGGIPEVFDERAGSWQTEFNMLKNILTPEEYASARESTLTAFYTPPTVIQAIYKVMEQLGFSEGNILEPSCGIGHFIGMLPESMKEAKVYGVELDTISAGIAQQLYQKTSIAAQPFEEANLPDSFFDAVVGNVPFGDFKVPDKRYDKHKFLIHDYFFAKSLDKLRPGGVMALITSKGTMDKENPAVRKYIAQRADLLGAIRLPKNTFKGNAGTEVVSDILILQKRDHLIDIEPDWVHLGKDKNGITMNSYFVNHPEMILGEMKMVSGRFGLESSCIPYEDADLAEQLSEAITNIHGEIITYEVDDELSEEDNSIPADPTVRNFSYTLLDGKIYFRENSRMAPVDVSTTAENRIKGMIVIRDCVRNLIELQTEDYPDSAIKAEQEKLNNLYDTFTAKYGLINSRANSSAFSQDSSFFLLSALEVLGDDGTLEKKADMFYKRTIKPHAPVTSVDTASEALAVSMGEKACIDMEYMCQLSGKTEEEIFADLKGAIFLNPKYGYGSSTEAKYLMADEYLSGNVREKLARAKKSAQLEPEDYSINVEALQKVQPKDLTASEISVRLGATWLPPEIVEQFIFEFLGTPRYAQWNIKTHFSEYTGEWNIEGKSYDKGNVKAYSTYGTSRINAYKIIEETLNLKDVRIFDYVEDADGKKKAVLNKKETAIAQSKQELIKQGFQDWIWSDPQRRERLTKLYNEKFNSIRPREYDGSHIAFNGMNPEIELREHQRNAVAHILYGGNTLLAHAVGAGKTFEMTAAAMEAKRFGLCSKSLFVVPNHLTEQWASEFLQLYPSANILVATKKDFETKNRKRFCGRIATGDYDAIIIGHSQFEKIPMSVERQRAILEQQLEEVTNGIADLKRNRGDNFSVKQLERTKKSVKQKLDKLNDQSKKDDVVTFEELGVDRLFIDESHYYKNLFLYTKMRNVGGIAQTEAQKSSDLFMKCRYLDEITGGRGTVFATGTPISNSMVELYTIQRYLQYNTLVKNNLQHFDAWASTFGETVTAVELTPEGTGYRAKTRFARFYNLPELMAMFKEVADIKTADMLDLPVPKAVYHNISVKPSEIQKQMVAELAERAEKVRSGMVDASVDNMLKITNDGRKLALDQRLINPMLPDFEGSKLNACVDAMFETWEKGKEKRLTQLFFCDLSTPKNDGNFSVYDDIRKKLIERGVPAEEIKFIHEADTEAKKLELFKKVRRGDVRILMGSTAKMGAGTNVQNKLAASSDLDCPWRPSDLEQRLGRSIRQGNENPTVDIFRFVTEETFDAYLYQLVEGKQKFASQIMTSKSPVRSCEDIDETALSYAEIKMLATGNPYIKEKMDLDVQVQKLRLLKSNFLSEKYALEDKIIKFYPQEIARRTDTIERLKSDIERAKQHPKPIGDTFLGMTVNGVFYSEKADAGNAILNACQAMTSPDPIPLGEYRGFQTELSFDIFEKEYKVKFKGELGYSVSLGTDTFGNITRLDNALDGLPKRLAINEQELDNIKKQFEIAMVDVEKPFNQEEELQTKTARLNELNALLNVDKRENEIVDGEPDKGDKVLKPKPKQKQNELKR